MENKIQDEKKNKTNIKSKINFVRILTIEWEALCPVLRTFPGLCLDVKMGLGQAFCSHSLGITFYIVLIFR